MSAPPRKRRRIQDSDDDHGAAPPNHYPAGIQSGMLVEDPMGNTDVDQTFDQTRQPGVTHFPVQNVQPSSSFTNLPGIGGLVSESPQQPRPAAGNMVIGGNSYRLNNDPWERLDDRASATHPKEQDKHFQPFTGASRNLISSYRSESSPEATMSTTMHSNPSSSVGYIVDSSLPSTYIRVKLPDGAAITGHFNFHHTIADVRSFIDALRPEGWRPYQLVIPLPGSEGFLTDQSQTIEQARLFNSVVHLRF